MEKKKKRDNIKTIKSDKSSDKNSEILRKVEIKDENLENDKALCQGGGIKSIFQYFKDIFSVKNSEKEKNQREGSKEDITVKENNSIREKNKFEEE